MATLPYAWLFLHMQLHIGYVLSRSACPAADDRSIQYTSVSSIRPCTWKMLTFCQCIPKPKACRWRKWMLYLGKVKFPSQHGFAIILMQRCRGNGRTIRERVGSDFLGFKYLSYTRCH
jgi:hypothetical protein